MNNFRKRLTLEVIFTILIAGVLLGGVLFLRNNIVFYRDNIILAKNKLGELTQNVSLFYNLQSQYKEAEGYLNKLNNLVPSYYDLINFNKDLQALATSHNLSYSFSFVGENVKTESGLGYINFNVVVSSPELDNLLKFLKDLQGFRYFNVVENISFITQRDNVISLSIKGKVFYR